MADDLERPTNPIIWAVARVAGLLLAIVFGVALALWVLVPVVIESVSRNRQQNAMARLRSFRAEVAEHLTRPGYPVSVSTRKVNVDKPMVSVLRDIHNVDSLELRDGRISDAAMEELPLAAPNLNGLSLDNVAMSDAAFSQINKLRNLEYLLVSGKSVTEERLCLLTDLKQLIRLSAVFPRDQRTVFRKQCVSVDRFPSLEWLGLGNVRIADNAFSGIATLTLKRLSLPESFWDKNGISQLARVSSLEILDLDSVEDDDLKHIGGLPRLHTLSLHRSRITDKGLAMLTGLKELGILDLRGAQVTDAGVEHLVELTGLVHLRAEDTEITEQGRATLLNRLPNVQMEIGKTPKPF